MKIHFTRLIVDTPPHAVRLALSNDKVVTSCVEAFFFIRKELSCFMI